MPTIRAVHSWGSELDQVAERIGVRFGRRDLRAHAVRYLRGLISRVERKNGWQLAEELVSPARLSHPHERQAAQFQTATGRPV